MDRNPAHKLDEDTEALCGHFTAAGAVFVTPAAELAAKLADIRALVFDWDGVFNTGRKGHDLSSTFSEADSMGTNLLRYGLWRKARRLPSSTLVSGEDNPSAIQFARREHFHSVYIGMSDKRLALRHLCSTYDIEPAQIACVFDDVNDLGMAAMCGIRCLVHRPASPLLRQYAIAQELCDYVTGNDSSHCAVREVCELFLGLLGIFDSVVASRMAYDDSYRDFFAQRQADTTRVFIQQAGEIAQREREE